MDQQNHRVNMAIRLLLGYMLEHREQLRQFVKMGSAGQEEMAWLNLSGVQGAETTPLPSPAESDYTSSSFPSS